VDSLRDHSLVGETRTIGLTAAVELDAEALEGAPTLVDDAVAAARKHGVLTRSLRGSALHVSPPFVITPRQIGALAGGFRAALDDVESERLAVDR
jgi:adenosylmethionine-8-amino-7-oxononanoate aminotransferase